MPIYEYNCQDCGADFEKLVRSSAPQVVCPQCGKDQLTTRYSTFAARDGAASAASSASEGCGASMCGAGACGSGMCGMNFN